MPNLYLVTPRFSGGHFGRLLLFYGTSDIDVVALHTGPGVPTGGPTDATHVPSKGPGLGD